MNIFVANLNFRMRDSDLQEIFEEYGEVESARIIKDRNTNKSKGFGFVEMPNDADANKAIKELDGAELEGRPMVVKTANERK